MEHIANPPAVQAARPRDPAGGRDMTLRASNALLPVDPAGIPAELKRLPRWVAWVFDPRPGKRPAKQPLNARTGKPADVTDPRQLVGFDDALGLYLDRGLAGVGFAFLAGDPYSGLDLDDCRDPHTGTLDPIAADLLTDLASYAEASPSGSGAKAIALGKLDPRGRKRAGNVELYDRGRYFALTGRRVPFCPATIEPREQVLRQLQAMLAPPRPPIRTAAAGGFGGDDRELLERAFLARNGARVRALWEGRHDKPSASEALLGLGRLLAFWTGPDPGRLERLLLRSPLFAAAEAERPKWGSRRRVGSWGMVYVVHKAIGSCPEFFRGAVLLPATPAAPCSGQSPHHTCVSSSSSHLGSRLNVVLRRVEAGHTPPGLDAITSHKRAHQNALRRLAAVVWHLAGRRAGGRCRLSVEAAARAFGVGTSSVSRWLGRLERMKVIRRTSWGNTTSGLCSEWLWAGLPARAEGSGRRPANDSAGHRPGVRVC